MPRTVRAAFFAILVNLATVLTIAAPRVESASRAGSAPRTYTVLARISAYTDAGITASGAPTRAGRTAGCSWDLPLGALVTVAGDSYVCEDRGDRWNPILQGAGATGFAWIDIYTNEYCVPGDCWVTSRYGDWQYIDVSLP